MKKFSIYKTNWYKKNKNKKKKQTPKIKNTLTRMWNDTRKVENIKPSQIKTNKQLMTIMSKRNKDYGKYLSYQKNPIRILGLKKSTNFYDYKSKDKLAGSTANFRKIIKDSKIRNKNIVIKENKKTFSLYSTHGKLLKMFKK